MAKEWSASKLVEALVAAGEKGLTKPNLEKRVPAALRSRSSSILRELREAGSIHGPFKKRADYYFAPQFAPTRAQGEGLIEKALLDAGARLTTRSELRSKANGFLRIFFDDALAALKSEQKIVEFRRGQISFYVHRDAVLEQLGSAQDSEPEPPKEPASRISRRELTLEEVRPVYERLKAEQGGIGTVRIYDILARMGVAKEDLHRLLLAEAGNGRVSLHRASTTKYSSEVTEAGILIEGQPEPLVTVALKEE